MRVLERVVKLELPQEDSDDDPPASTTSSSSFKPLPPKPTDISTTSTSELYEAADDQENIYETIST